MTSPLASVSTFLAQDNRELQQLAVQAIREAQATDPFAPVTLLVPGAAQGWALRRQIAAALPAGKALANIRIATSTEFLESVAHIIDPSRQPADRIVRTIAVEQLLASETGPLRAAAGHKDTAQLLLRLSDELAWCSLAEHKVAAASEVCTTTASEAIRFVRRMREELPAIAAIDTWHSVPADPTAVATLATEFGTIIVVDQRVPSSLAAVLESISSIHPCVRVALTESQLSDDAVTVTSCPDPGTEVTIAVRSVAQELVNGAMPERVAILYAADDPYPALLEVELAEAGLNWHGPTADALITLTLPRVAMLFAQMAAKRTTEHSGITRRDLMHWFAIGSMTVGEDRVTVTNLREFIRDESLYGDARRWRSVLQAFESSVAPVAAQEDPRSKKRARSVASAALLLRLIDAVDAHLQRMASASTWQQLGSALYEAIREFHMHPRWMSSEEDERSSQTMLQNLLLKSLPRIDLVELADSGIPAVQLPQLLERQFVGRRTRHGVSAAGIHVGPIGSVRGLHFDHVVLLGAMEGMLPSTNNANPLLPDEARHMLRGRPDDLPTGMERMALMHRELMAVLSAALTVQVTFPRAGLAKSAEGRISRYFAHLQKSDTCPSRLSATTTRLPVTSLDSAVQTALTSHEVDADLVAQLNTAKAWHHPVLGETFGAVPETSLDGQRLSASGVEVFLHCPYNYFVSRMLKVGTDQYPDDIDVISASDFGTLLHKVFEEFLSRATPAQIPGFGEAWPEGSLIRLAAILDEHVDAARAAGTVGWLPAWDRQYNTVKESLLQFLLEDTSMRSAGKFRPTNAELEFGTEDAPVQMRLSDGAIIHFRGFIDRVDENSDGNHRGVVDYKSGSATFFEKSMKAVDATSRDKVQDLVYDLAIRTLYPDTEAVDVNFFFFPNDGEPKLVPAPQLNRRDLLLEIMESMQQSAVTGRFQPAPTGPRDFCPVCKLLGRRAARVTLDEEDEND